MRIGCFGCLALLVLLLVIVVAVLGIVFLSGNITSPPDNTYPVRFPKGDGYSAQQKLYELVLRQNGRSSPTDPVVITEPEANGFLANHLVEAADLPFNPMSLKFQNGQVEFRGQTP